MLGLLEQLGAEPARLLVWGLVPRAIGLTFLVAYASLWRQVLPLIGSRGIEPAALQFRRLREDLPFFERLRIHPSLLWLSHSDLTLRLVIAGGMIAACGMIIGGAAAWWCALYCWAMWLSLQFPLRLIYPWDTVLLESGFLCLWLPRTGVLPSLAATELPHPLLPFLFHLLIFRILFGFGKTKFVGIRRKDWNYTKYFLHNMPLCSRIGWRFSRLPDGWHKLTLAGMAFVELLCPFLVLIPGPLRLIGGIGIVGQMIGIWVTGNFGYFNLLTIGLCISTLDLGSSVAAALANPAALVTPENLPLTLVAAFVVAALPFYIVLDSWFTYAFLAWPGLERLKPGPLRALFALFRAVEPLHIMNSYGVFHARGAPPVRWVTVVEGSEEGKAWKKYRYPFTMTDETSGPRFVAPHHPRLDHQTFYDGVGVDGSGFIQPIIFSNPYLFTPSMVLDRTVQRLFDPQSPVRTLFKEVPFDRPPRFGRAMLYRFTPTAPDEEKATGRYWNVEPVGPHILPTEVDDEVWTRWMPPPELFHPEASRWRRRARVCTGVTAAEAAAFWDDFLPFVQETGKPYAWTSLEPLQQEIRRRWSRGEVRAFHLTLARLTMIVMARLEAVFSRPATHFMRDVAGFPRSERPDVDPLNPPAGVDRERVWQALAAWPHGPLRTRFHVWLAARWIVLQGREAFARAAGADASLAGSGRPIRTVIRLPFRARFSMSAAAEAIGLELDVVQDAARELTIPKGMFLEGAANYDMVARFTSRLRVMYSSSGPYKPAPTGIFPGLFELTGELRNQPALRELLGWGETVQPIPPHDVPQMAFGDDSVWREVPPGATASTA